MGFRWMEADRQFQLLATIAGDFLGPLWTSFHMLNVVQMYITR
jgi:hypothetical protein